MFALTISKEKQEQIIKIASTMSEKQKRQFLASEAALPGYGGVSLISRITGVSRITIIRGLNELKMEIFLDRMIARGLLVVDGQTAQTRMMNCSMP